MHIIIIINYSCILFHRASYQTVKVSFGNQIGQLTPSLFII